MDKSSNQIDAETDGDNEKKPVSREIKLTLLSSAVSATLRLVIPVMGLFLLGLAVDALLGQMATWAIVGAVVGFLVAAYLIYMQIKKIQKEEEVKTSKPENPDKAWSFPMFPEPMGEYKAMKKVGDAMETKLAEKLAKTSVKKSTAAAKSTKKTSSAKTSTKKSSTKTSPRKSSPKKSAKKPTAKKEESN